MEELIRKEDVTDLYICGIATDVCVGILTLVRVRTLLHLTNFLPFVLTFALRLVDMVLLTHPCPQHSQRSTARNRDSGPSWWRTPAEEFRCNPNRKLFIGQFSS